MTDNDRNWGPFTLARWRKRIALEIESGDDEDPESFMRMMAFGWALRIKIPKWLIRPHKTKVKAQYWDEATIKQLGRDWYYDVKPRQFGFALSDMGNGYDFLQVFYGRHSNSSNETKSWSKHLPWKQWNHVRWSIYTPDGTHFATEPKGKFFEFYETKEKCPKSYFLFQDYDGKAIIASCTIEEREWHRGEGWFKWLKWFYPKKIHRSLDIHFSEEVGAGKGSWKGGTLGHGIDMLPGESPIHAFMRYCSLGHSRKGNTTTLHFLGPCDAPPPKPVVIQEPGAYQDAACKST